MSFLLENRIILLFILAYLLIISITAVSATAYDKWAAKSKPGSRVAESTLILISFLGGAVAMLLTMLAIRHKTKHIKFMLGIPIILVFQSAISAVLLYLI